MYSRTWRYELARRGVLVGAYSYGSLLIPGATPAGLEVGRYVSIASGVRWTSDHPTDRISTHPALYKHSGTMPPMSLVIEHDAWIGTNAIITVKCKRIGFGAIIGAGSIVTKDVPDFAIVIGSPARVFRYRFPPETQSLILASKWWESPPVDAARIGSAALSSQSP